PSARSRVTPRPVGLRSELKEEASAPGRGPGDIRGAGRPVAAARPAAKKHRTHRKPAAPTYTPGRTPIPARAMQSTRSRVTPRPVGLRSELKEEASAPGRGPGDIRGAGRPVAAARSAAKKHRTHRKPAAPTCT